MGPQAGADGGYVIAKGTVEDIIKDPVSMIGPFLAGKGVNAEKKDGDIFEHGQDTSVHLRNTYGKAA